MKHLLLPLPLPFDRLWGRRVDYCYLPISTNSTLMSEGETPLIRDA